MSATAVVVCTISASGAAPGEEAEAALTLGRSVARAGGGELRWLVLGPDAESAAAGGLAETAARYGVAAVDRIGEARIGAGGPDATVEALARYATQQQPALMVFNQDFATRDLAPRLAGRLDGAVVMNVAAVEPRGGSEGGFAVTAAAYGGDTRVIYEVAGGRPCVVALPANAVVPEPQAEPGPLPAVNDVAVDLDAVQERVRVVEAAHTEGPRLEDAEIVVAGGRGLGKFDHWALVEELAEVLGGMAGASRPLVDDGWTDSSHQVGLTGRITRPRLYLAAGISGATQHMVGCSAAKTIVAVNTDADAAIFRHARYGIVGDCAELLPELIRAAREQGVS